jgi:hypothetical protein
MTEIELRQRLSASVDDIEVPSDLLDRVRLGGARRLRRRRITALAGTALAVTALVGSALAVPGLLDGRALDRPAVAPASVTPAADDPYSFLMKGKTRGNLAGDTGYLGQVLTASVFGRESALRERAGITIELHGDPKVYWAGNTPSGRIAIVAQHFDVHSQGNVKVGLKGIYTFVGFVADDNAGKPMLKGVQYPMPDADRVPTYIASKGGTDTLVAVDIGRPAGWSAGPDANGRHEYTPLLFEDGVSVLELPHNVDPSKVSVLPLQPR